MRIPRLLTTLFTLLVALAGVSARAQNSGARLQHTASCYAQKDEIEVYADYLSPGSNSSDVTVVVTSTQPSDADVDSLNLQLAVQGRGIPPDVRADFKQKDKSICSMEPFPAGKSIRFISKNENETIFKAGWKEFHRRYGKDASWLQFSRVGFNSDKTLALLHVSWGADAMAGGGTLYLFERKAGKWVIKSSVDTWTT
jgi:hypothetical protein